MKRVVALLLAAAAWAAFGAARSDDAGTPFDIAKAPHLRSGLWRLDFEVNGRPMGERLDCDVDRSIGSAQRPACDPWAATFKAPNHYAFAAVCHDGVKLLHGHRTFDGDLQSHFVVSELYTTELAGVVVDRQAVRTTYTFLGRCPAGAAIRTGAF